MSRWAIRLVGLLIVLAFMMIMFSLYRQLVAMQRAQQPATTTTSSP